MSETEKGLLAGLGVSAAEEAAYRALLRHGPLPLSKLAEPAGLSTDALRRLVPSLEQLGLVSRLAGRPLRLTATPPTVAIDALAARRQDELASSRAAATVLAAEETWSPDGEPEQLIEIVNGPDAVARRYYQLHEMAQHEVLGLIKPPFAIDTGQPNLAQEAGMRRGVRARSIYGPSAFEDPAILMHVKRCVAAGEQARIGEVPIKLAIADAKVAILPLTSKPVTVESALVVQASALLDALVSLFEALWRTAAPLELSESGTAATSGSTLDLDVVALLASGMQDEAVARQLGVSARTLQRRLQTMFDQLGGRTRFQAGFRAGLRAAGDVGRD
ncbi:sugar-specific transcriptional regulator TrmB [Haloactinopolyspora alba]|uniref:Sugar-specific transcriptional regulator TrmB n=1 Tax=Haloactinopolyspora alba TaxID=648780 RepID=A0A2P8DWP5_9ACTN|nr:helix-turn-helix domain-containing protein [Haloactinopolyspora alba]PSL01645.1 sugar-specific transcriptional regulator TrmB [Haloactinopolyspora alba]